MSDHADASHACHVPGCGIPIPPKLLMCRRHWAMVPKGLQLAVWEHYRPGQELDKRPAHAYLRAAREAIHAVLGKETAAVLAASRERPMPLFPDDRPEGQP